MKEDLNYWKPAWLKFAIPALALAYVTINVFQIGGSQFIFSLNNALPAPLSAMVAIFALLVGRRIADLPNRRLWLGLSAGFLCWGVAEVLWAVLALIRQKPPYPSIADFFWFAGYLIMYVVIGARWKALPKVAGRSSRWKIWLWIFSFLSVFWSLYFVLLPAVRAATPEAFLESAVSITYILASLVLLVLSLRLLSAVQAGVYGRVWLWISLGFVLFAVANLLYARTFAADTYQYHLDELNWINTLAPDVSYTLSYLLILLGISIMWGLVTSFRPTMEVRTNLVPIPNAHLLVFVKGDDTIIGVSRNYYPVYQGMDARGKTLSEALGLSPDEEAHALREIKSNGILRERPFLSVTPTGQREVRISGIRVQNPQGEYAGATFLVRLYAEDPSLDQLLTSEQKGTVQYVSSKTGVKEREEEEARGFLTEYCRAHLTAFYDRIYAEGGGVLADAFLSELQMRVEAQGWRVRILPDRLELGTLSLSETQQVCGVILETGRQILNRLIGTLSTDALLNQIHAGFPPGVVGIASRLIQTG